MDRHRGMALILVILVLATLALIGTPFVVSMKLQERGSVHSVAFKRAEFAAQSARNHALAHLMETHPVRERRRNATAGFPGDSAESPAKTFAAPAHKWDAIGELEVPIGSALPLKPGVDGVEAPPFVMRGWNDRILDVQVEDEQGKVNLNTAYPNLLGNLFGGSTLAEGVRFYDDLTELPLADTTPFVADDDPHTVDGVVVILNPMLLLFEAVSYRGKSDTHLTGCFRGEYLSAPLTHERGFPVFDIRGMKVFLHRYYHLAEGELRTFRTPQSIREIADWSIVPYFLENLALLGLNLRNMKEFGLTPQLLARAGLDEGLLRRPESDVDAQDYRAARRKLVELGIPEKLIEMLENFRGPAAVIEGAELAGQLEIGELETNALQSAVPMIEGELKKIQQRTQKYFPKAIEAYKEIAEQPGLETITAEDFEQVRDLITTSSSIPSEWGPEQSVIGPIRSNPLVGFPTLKVERTDWFNPGTLVRVRSNRDPGKVEYQLAAFGFPDQPGGSGGGNRRQQRRATVMAQFFQGGIMLKGPLRHRYEEGEAMIAPLLRHPININSAPRKVLEAVLTGIRGMRGGVVEPNEARALTERLLNNMPIVGFGHLREILRAAVEAQTIDSDDYNAILINAVNPNYFGLIVSTTGFCYTTGDVYSIESTGIINNPAGVEVAARRVRELIEVAPPDPLMFILDSQDDWAHRLWIRPDSDRRSWRLGTVSYPGRRGHLMITQPRPLFLSRDGRGFVPPAMDVGSLTGITAELEESSFPVLRKSDAANPTDTITWNEVEHFPQTIDGYDVAVHGPHQLGTVRRQSAGSTPAGGTPDPYEDDLTDLVTLPACVEFWVKPNWSSRTADRTFFDTVADPDHPDRNRIRLFFDGATQDLVFQVMDDAGLEKGAPRNGSAVAAAEIRHAVGEHTFANDTWYHIAAAWGSTHPGDQALFIDGRLVGRNSWVTELAAPLAIDAGIVAVADVEVASRYPPRGTLLVGTESIDYVAKEGTRFRVRTPDPRTDPTWGRGARGTIRQSHPRGSTVRLFGYSVDAAPSNPDTAMSLSGDIMLIGKGGAQLARNLEVSNRREGLGWVPNSYALVTMNTVPEANDSTLWVRDDPRLAGFPAAGYLHIEVWSRVGTFSGLVSYTREIHEYVKYASILPGPNGSFMFTGLGRGMLGTDRVDRDALAYPTAQHIIEVRSVSIEMNVTDLDERYPPNGGVIQFALGGSGGSSTTSPLAVGFFHDVEWIRYEQIVEGRYFIAAPHRHRVFRGFTGNRRLHASRPDLHGRWLWDANAVRRHPAKVQEAFPVIRVTRPQVGVDDFVSVGDSYGNSLLGQFEPKLHRVRKARHADAGSFVSLWDQLTHNYFVRGNPKIKKFPSGERPSRSSQVMLFGDSPIPGGGGGPLEATIDEIRLSRIAATDVDITAFPAPRGRLSVYDLAKVSGTPTHVRTRAIRTFYRSGDGVGAGEEFDRVLLLGGSRLRPILNANGSVVGREFTAGHPRGFGLGRPEGLFHLENEVFHYTDFEVGSVEAPTIIQLAQDLPRDHLALDDPATLRGGNDRFIDDRRDLRSEVIPEILVNTTEPLPPRDGFLEVISDERKEVIYYESASNNRLRNCLRGQLGTPVGSYQYTYFRLTSAGWEPHYADIFLRVMPQRGLDLRTRSMLNSERRGATIGPKSILTLPQLNITRVAGTMTHQSLPVISTEGFGRQPGYLILDDGNPSSEDEIIAYKDIVDGAFVRARDSRTLQGIFRGRFGTEILGNIAADTNLVELPTRYHDRYQSQVDSPDLMLYERHVRIPGAHWDRISWTVQKQRNRTFKTEVRVLVRFDGVPPWDEQPTNQPGGLYLFTDGEADNGVGLEADLLELRIMVRYPRGAYGRVTSTVGGGWADDWKHSPVIDRLSVDYRKAWRVIHRENLPY